MSNKLFSKEEVLSHHSNNSFANGKIEVLSKVALNTRKDLSLAYTPGVAEVCREIYADPSLLGKYTIKDNMVAVITDGSAILGLGNIGPRAGLPVMEGKALLFKMLAGVDAFPICLDTQDSDKIVEVVKLLEPTFGGINLEDIAAPRCLYIEERLINEMEIPIMHDDQHGTAVVVLAALINALKVVKKEINRVKIVVNGIGAAGTAIIKLLREYGAENIIACDKIGILSKENSENNSEYPHFKEIIKITNKENINGLLKDAIVNADVFIGVSAKNLLTEEMVNSMADEPIIMAMANPDPEIAPELAKKTKARIIATGRSDYPNQVNNVLGFPGIFRGALDVKAKVINNQMKIAAAKAIAGIIPDNELNEENIIPSPLNLNVMPLEAKAVAEAAIMTSVNKINIDPEFIKRKTEKMIELNKKKFDAIKQVIESFN